MDNQRPQHNKNRVTNTFEILKAKESIQFLYIARQQNISFDESENLNHIMQSKNMQLNIVKINILYMPIVLLSLFSYAFVSIKNISYVTVKIDNIKVKMITDLIL